MLGFISRSLNRFKKIETYKVLFFTYVRSMTEYCLSVWAPHYNIYVNKLERIQKCFTRKIYYKFHFPYERYEIRLLRLQMISLFDRRMITDELNFHKIYNDIIKTKLKTEITPRHSNWTLRNMNLFYLPFVTTNIEYYSAIIRMQRRHDEVFCHINLRLNRTIFRTLVFREISDRQRIF